MAVTVTNLVQGPADLWIAPFGSAEPAETVAGVTGDPVSPWVNVGGTLKGLTLSIDQTYDIMDVDQVVDKVGARLTSRNFSVDTTLAELTLENLAVCLNNIGAVSTAVTGLKTLDPVNASSVTQPNYAALIVDGFAPAGSDGAVKRRRVIVRKVLVTKGASLVYDKTNQAGYKVAFDSFYVSTSVKPFHVIDVT